MHNWAEQLLGEHQDDILISSSEDNTQAAVRMAEQAQASLDIFSRNLDDQVYNNRAFIDAVKRFVLSGPRCRMRILVIDTNFPISHGHQLIELSRRFSSYIQIRKVHEHYASTPEAFMTVDDRGYIHRKLASRYDAIVCFNDPQHAANLTRQFNEVWEHSKADMNYQRLHI